MIILTLPKFVLLEKKSRVKNIFIQKVNSSVCHWKKENKMKEKCGHPLKEFAAEDLSAVWKGRGEGQERRLS